MFRKLLGYDMKSVWNVWRVMAVTIFSLSVVGSFVLRYILTHADKLWESPGLMLMLSGFMLCAFLSVVTAFAVTVIFVYLRFYKNFFTDEGYLTFTLPVKRSTLLNVKTANAMIWALLLIAFIIVCALPFSIISPPSENGELINFVVYEEFWDSLKYWWNDNPYALLQNVVGFVIVPISFIFFSVTSMQLCITVGALLVKRAKVLLGIGIYYAFSMATGFIRQTWSIVYMLFIRLHVETFLSDASQGGVALYYLFDVFVTSAILLTFGFIFHSITRACIERRLNLA